MVTSPVLDFASFFGTLDAARRERGLGWYELADELWGQSADLNAQRTDHPLCGGAVSRLGGRGAISCQYALFMLRWLGRPPEDFLIGLAAGTGTVALPKADPHTRLRWDLAQLHQALHAARTERGLTWADLGRELGCTPARLTNLKTARIADLELVMRILRGLGRQSTDFIHPASW